MRSYPYEFARSIIFGELRKAVQTLFVDMDDLEKATRDNRIKGDECAKKDALDERDRDLKGKWMAHHVDCALKSVRGRWTDLPQRAHPSNAYVVKLASQVNEGVHKPFVFKEVGVRHWPHTPKSEPADWEECMLAVKAHMMAHCAVKVLSVRSARALVEKLEALRDRQKSPLTMNHIMMMHERAWYNVLTGIGNDIPTSISDLLQEEIEDGENWMKVTVLVDMPTQLQRRDWGTPGSAKRKRPPGGKGGKSSSKGRFDATPGKSGKGSQLMTLREPILPGKTSYDGQTHFGNIKQQPYEERERALTRVLQAKERAKGKVKVKGKVRVAANRQGINPHARSADYLTETLIILRNEATVK